MNFKSFLTKPVHAGENAAARGGSSGVIEAAEKGREDLITPTNLSAVSGPFRVAPPKCGLMTSNQLARLKATAKQVEIGSKNAVEGLALVRQIGTNMTAVKTAHDQTVLHQAKLDLQQSQSQHAVVTGISAMRPDWLNMRYALEEQETYGDGYQEGFSQFKNQANELMALAG